MTMNPNKLGKRERKLRRRLERAHESGIGRDIREARRAYMLSPAARGVAALEANRRLPPNRRVTDPEALEAGTNLRWGRPIAEKVRTFKKQKPNGGTRPLVAFGLKNRTLQTMLRRVVQTTAQLQPWQYEGKPGGASTAVLDIKAQILAGNRFSAELDIESFYQGFTEAGLQTMTPFSAKVVRHNLLAPPSSSVGTHHSYSDAPKVAGQKPATHREGIPQGSTLSPLVASVMVARLGPMPGVALFNWCDNFLVLAPSHESVTERAKALQAAVAALPGEFRIKVKRVADARQGISFLGHLLLETKVGVSITPSQKRHDAFYERLTGFQARCARALAKGDEAKALEALASMWRFARGWCAAMRACDDIGEYRDQVRREIETVCTNCAARTNA